MFVLLNLKQYLSAVIWVELAVAQQYVTTARVSLGRQVRWAGFSQLAI